jgi:hypothetical protein
MISLIMKLFARISNAQKKSVQSFFLNGQHTEDDLYEALVLAYSREMDQLMEANTISSKVEHDDFATFSNDRMTKSNDEEENMVLRTPSPKNAMMGDEEESTKPMTPCTKTGSNDPNNTPIKIGFV